MKRERGSKTCQKRYTISKRPVSGFDSGLGGGGVVGLEGRGGSVEREVDGAW